MEETARAGKSGISSVLVTPREASRIKQIEKIIKRKFDKCLVPEGKEICEKQLFNMIEEIKSSEVDQSEIEAYLPAIMDELQDFDKETLIIKLVGTEFNKFLKYYKNAKDINANERGGGERSGRDEQDANSDRLFINLGAKDGLNKGALISYICDETGTNGKVLGRIDMMDSFSFFQIEKEFTQQVIKELSSKDYDGRALRVEVAGPRKGGGGGGNRRKNGGKFSGNRRSSGNDRSGGSRRGGGNRRARFKR